MKDYDYYMQELTKPGLKLPPGCFHLYVAHHAQDKTFTPVLASFKAEVLAEECSKQHRGYKVFRMAVTKNKETGKWHKVGLRPVPDKVFLDTSFPDDSANQTRG